MVVRPFAAVFPHLANISDPVSFLEDVKVNYPAYHGEGLFTDPQAPAMYVYQIATNKHRQTGLLAAVAVQSYLEDQIRRHEHTLVAKEIKQAELLAERQAVVKPVLLAHRHHQALADLLAEHVVQHAATTTLLLPELGEEHRFWAIRAPAELEQIQYYFGRYIRTAYIADGHHRFSAIARLYQQLAESDQPNSYEYLMCALFPSSGLEIHNFNRCVKAFEEEVTPLSFMVRLSHYANLRLLPHAQGPERPHEITFYLEGQWFALEWRPETMASNIEAGLPTLDVSMLNYYVLGEILGFTDVRNDKRIKYIEGPQGLTALAALTNDRPAISFCLHPLSWESFFRVIDHGLILPPKSTWFEPRMKNGLIVQVF
ncbi:MAG: hypothetical protein C7N36_12490 [Bacteroidetes bacterium]|nr:MAG: hypothetical protein C7N36_12490 [Bacteroidota bacterium]